MRRGPKYLFVLFGCACLSACGSNGSPVVAGAPTTTESPFAHCVAPTLPNGTYLDENGKPAYPPEAGPLPELPPGQKPRDSNAPRPPPEPEVPADVAAKARTIAEADKTLGRLLQRAEVVETLEWTGQDDAPIGVILDYRFDPPVDLPMSHGEIVGAAGDGYPGKYDERGFPVKRALPSDASFPKTDRAEVYVDVAGGAVSAANQTNRVHDPC